MQNQPIKAQNSIFALVLVMILSGCHMPGWNHLGHTIESGPPNTIREIFQAFPDQVYRTEALCPGYAYTYDVAEKAQAYGNDEGKFRFNQVEIRLLDRMPKGKVLADIRFLDQVGNIITLAAVDLLRFTPKIDASGDLIYPEIILEELNRFGLGFRKEFAEFQVQSESPELESAYRVWLVNSCLDPGKWEFSIVSEDYSDFKNRKAALNNLNQNRLLSHSWFQFDKDLYQALLEIKNPGKAYNVYANFDSISDLAEQVVVNWDELRNPLRHIDKSEILEIGHQSGRRIEPIDTEEYYKWDFGLFLNRPSHLTYASILEQEVQTAKFMDEGFYRDDTPRKFNFNWLKQMDSVEISIVDIPGSDCYAEIKLTGKWSWYEITIGNVDLAMLEEQKRFGMLFGINTYPKSRRYNPKQSTIQYDAVLLPKEIQPYVLLTEKGSGKWVNNQYKGIEKIYLSYEGREKDVLEIYVLSYERITPVWMARVKLSNPLREAVRIRNRLYNY